MKTDNPTNEVFEALRNTPTELSLERVEHLMATLAPIPFWKSWFHHFNLNSMLMIATTISISLAALILSPEKAPAAINEATPVLTNEVFTEGPRPIAPEEEAYPILPKNELQKVGEDEKSIVSEVMLVDSHQQAPSLPAQMEPVRTLSPRRLPASPLEVASRGLDIVEKCASIPHQSSRQLRHFKRQLLEDLHQDHLIYSPKQQVLIEVPIGEIRVNGKVLPSDLFSKYSGFLYPTIPPCQGRYLVISHQFFGAGNYTSEGNFEGLTIHPEKMPSWYEVQSSLFPDIQLATAIKDTAIPINGLWESEGQALAKDDQVALDSQTSDIVIAWPKVRRLKRKLLAKLLEDKLITRDNKQAIIGLHEDEIVVNGTPLTDNHGTAYRVMIGVEFGVECGPRREIHLDPKFILIGDFGEYGEMLKGQAHGKGVIASERMPSGLYADRNFRHLHQLRQWKAQ